MLKQSGRNILTADSRHTLVPLDPIEAARETLLNPRRLDRIRSCREPLRQQAQFFGAKTVPLAFQDCEFRGLEGDLFPRWLARHHLVPRDRLPHEPMIDGQCALDHVSSL